MVTVFDQVALDVAETLVKLWTCRHCGGQTPVISEFCNDCGIEDLRQGKGEELARDRERRLAGKRGTTGLWSDGRAASLARDLVR